MSQARSSSLLDCQVPGTRRLRISRLPNASRYLATGSEQAERAARIGRNPQTGEAIKVKAKTPVKFRLAKSATEAVAPPRRSCATARRLFAMNGLRLIRRLLLG
jgi:hypothetical protein